MLSLVDLFSGCGGLAYGAKQAGFATRLAIDVDPILTSSFSANFPNTRLVNENIAELDRGQLTSLIPFKVAGVLGGPPCQAFSEIGLRSANDPRRSLVREFFRVVSIVRPAFFLMENVRGLGFDRNRPLLDAGVELLNGNWEIVGPILLDAADYGAPTRRVRLFIFGFDRTKMDVPSLEAIKMTRGKPVNVGEAIADLQSAKPAGVDEMGFDWWRYGDASSLSNYAKRMRSREGTFTGNQRTVHSEATLERFAMVNQGGVDLVGKHRRLAWDGLCPTLRAGTGSDRGSYQSVRPLHPTEDRVITPREAARLQGFPDEFVFHRTIWHSFRMIGNSVSPILAEGLLSNIRPYLGGEGNIPLAAD